MRYSTIMSVRLRHIVMTVLLVPMFAVPVQSQTKTKVEIVPMVGHRPFTPDVAFSPEGARFVSSDNDRQLKLWDVESGALLRSFIGHTGPVRAIAVSPDGTRIASGGLDKSVKLWNAETGALIRNFEEHSLNVTALFFTNDGKQVVSLGRSRSLGGSSIKVWSLTAREPLRTLTQEGINAIAMTLDGTAILTGGWGAPLRQWNIATGALMRTIRPAGKLSSIAVLPRSGDMLTIVGDDEILRIAPATGAVVRSYKLPSTSAPLISYTKLDVSADGARAVSLLQNRVAVWDLAKGSAIREIVPGGRFTGTVALSPDGRHIVTGGSAGLKLWNAATGDVIRSFNGRSSPIDDTAITSNGARALTGYMDNDGAVINVWDTSSGGLLRTIRLSVGRPQVIRFVHNGAYALTGPTRDEVDRSLHLWRTEDGARVKSFEGHGKLQPREVGPFESSLPRLVGLEHAATSADGKLLMTFAGDGTFRLWDVASGRLVGSPDYDEKLTTGIRTLALSPDGTTAVVGGNPWDGGGTYGRLVLLNTKTGRIIDHLLKAHVGNVTAASYSRDGTQVYTAGEDGVIQIWDAATGALQRQLAGPIQGIASIALSADGKHLLSAGSGGSFRLWDVATGTVLQSFDGQLATVRSAAFAPDGVRMISSSFDGTMRIWNLATGALMTTHVASAQGDWLSMTPTGFFAMSERALGMVSAVRGFGTMTIDQIHQSLYNPDLVREALRGDPEGEVARASVGMNLDILLDSGPAPRVEITSHPTGASVTSDVVTIAARITDGGKGIGRIEWRVNGVTAGVDAARAGERTISLSRQLALDEGDNDVEVVAYTAANTLASRPVRTTFKLTATQKAGKPTLHVLAIGINDYIDEGGSAVEGGPRSQFDKLGLAVHDARTFGAQIRQAPAGLYGDVQVTLALDKDATQSGLDAAIDRLAPRIHPRDTFILFAAAHGYSHAGRFYLIPRDYQGGPNPAALARGAIGQDRLQDWLANRIKARRALVLLDTCESGALVAGHMRSRMDSAASEAGVGRLHEATGRPVLAAAAIGKPALEGYRGHGVFTWALLDALRGGDTNGNGTIELSELVAHVQNKVPRISTELGAAGRSLAAVAMAPPDQQSARFGSRGDNFAVLTVLVDPAR